MNTNNTDVTKQTMMFVFVAYATLIVFQNLLSMFVSEYSPLSAKMILGAKDFILFLALSIILLNMLLKPFKVDFVFYSIVLVIYLSASFIADPAVSILSARQLMIIPLSLIFGSFLYKSKLDVEFVFKIYIYFVVLIVAFAYIERYMLYDIDETFWNSLGIKEYLELKGLVHWGNVDVNVPNSFYSFDFYNFTGEKIRRMVSLIAEPTLFGQLLVLPTFYYILRKKYIYALFFSAPVLFALSKGGLFGIVVAYTLYLWVEKSNVVHKTIILCLIMMTFLITLYLYINNSVQSISNHIDGFVSNMMILSEKPFGLGFGMAGNFYNITAGGENITSGESYLGAIVGQFGLIGLFFYLMFFYKVFKCDTRSNVMLTAVKYSMLAVLVTGFFSESAISYVGTSLLLVLTAYLFYYRRVICFSYEASFSYNGNAKQC